MEISEMLEEQREGIRHDDLLVCGICNHQERDCGIPVQCPVCEDQGIEIMLS